MLRRHLLRVGFALLLGIFGTAATAWAMALRPTKGVVWQLYSKVGGITSDRDVYIMEERRPWHRTFHIAASERGYGGSIGPAWQFHPNPVRGTPVWMLQPAGTAAIAQLACDARPQFVTPEPPRTASGWPAWLPPIPEEPAGLIGYGGRASGWPWATMRSVVRVDGATGVARWLGKLRLRPASDYARLGLNLQDPEMGCVPLIPVALPFVVSTLAWAIPAYVLLTGPGLVRARVRARRGRCRRCGYDIGGVALGACPECGAAVDSERGQSSITQ